MENLKPHPYADIFPMIEDNEFEQLKADIKANGLIQPIVLYEGLILDGRNRYKACQALEIEPRFETYTGDDPLNYVISLNLKRRHLNESQRGVIASKLANMTHGGDRISDQVANLPLVTQEEAGKTLNVSPRMIRTIRQIEREAPQYITEIAQGKKTANEVITEIKKEERHQFIQQQKQDIADGKIKLPEGKYEVIVVDPPWEYGNVDNYSPDSPFGRVANPYPEMTLEQIKNLEIPSSDDCVLWLWTTHKYIFDCRNILEAWGFRDVSVLTWVKNKIGVGYYLRSQSEYCIMAIKGKPIINLTNESTVLIADNTGHSIKPIEFYNMVDKLCIGRKLDYFARDKKEGWDSFGLIKYNEM